MGLLRTSDRAGRVSEGAGRASDRAGRASEGSSKRFNFNETSGAEGTADHVKLL